MASETSQLIAKEFNINVEQALSFFKKSIIYHDIISSGDLYDTAMPGEIFELWKNERLTGTPISTNDIEAGALKNLTLK